MLYKIRLCTILLTIVSTSLAGEGLRYENHQPYVFRDSLINGEPCQMCPAMVMLPQGRFLMGAFPGEGHSDEQDSAGFPLEVVVDHSLAMSVMEVTRQQFKAFLETRQESRTDLRCNGFVDGEFWTGAGDGWSYPGFEQGATHPVVCVDWDTAQDYALWLTELTGFHYRLPSEAEWEFAAKAGRHTRYWWGDSMARGYANCLEAVCDSQYEITAPANSLSSNPFGLYHMLGNVWEWVEDCYYADAYKQKKLSYPEPVSESLGCKRVIRGGSWNEGDWSLRASNREGWMPDRPLNDIGFRLVRESRKVPI